MKICYITTVHGTLRTFVLGAAEYIHSNTDWDISVICNPNEEFAAALPEYIHYYPVPMKRGISLGGIAAMLKMAKIFRKEKFDMVQYSTPNASLYASLAARIAGVPVRLYCQWGIAYVGFQGIKRRVFKTLEKIVCRLSTQVEPDSFGNLMFSRAEGLYSEAKSAVVWNGSACGVCLKRFDIRKKEQWRQEIRTQLGIPGDAFVYGFVGRITRDKGIDELLAAYRAVAEQHPDTCLLIAGKGENEHLLDQELYSWAHREKQVFFCGRVNDVQRYIAAMDVYILPSYREGFGSAVIEAEAMAVPVIVSDIPGPTDAMVRDQTGLVVKKADVDSLHEAMLRIKDDDALRIRLGEAARTFARENFEQQQLFAHILEDRKRLLAKGRKKR